MSYYDNDRLKQFFFIMIILILGGVLFWKISSFIPAFLGALTLYVIMRPMVIHLVYKRRWKRWIAAVLLIILSVIVLLIPMALIVNLMASKVTFVISHSDQLLNSLKELVARIKVITHIDLLSEQTMQKLQDAVTTFLPHFLGTTFNVVTTLLIMYFILYFMLTESLEMEDRLYEYSPLKDENTQRVGSEIKSMVISNGVGIPLLAIVQGLFCILGYWIFGIKDFLFWGVVSGFMSMIPVVGTTIVWAALTVFLLAGGHTGQGIGLLIYGLAVITNVDNVFRMIWQRTMADVHPLITVLGVFVGISLFGFVGIIFGPLLISMFILLLKIYVDEFGVKKRPRKVR